MTIDVYSATGTKKGTATLPKELFEATVNEGLMHQAVVRQQSNRRHAIAHVKSRGEVQGSTRKLFRQKGTGRARRGSIRSPLLRGGGKAFGPRNVRNFVKDMPKKMRRNALFSSLTVQAKNGVIIGLEGYPEEPKTKKAQELLSKLPVELGRRILVVVPEKHEALGLALRNIPRVKVVTAAYLNTEDVLLANNIVFLVDALKKAEEVFTTVAKAPAKAPAAKKEEKAEAPKKASTAADKPAKKAAPKAGKKSDSSDTPAK